MFQTAVETTLLVLGIYLAVGVLFAIPFVLKGAMRIDPSAVGASIGLRLLLIPASVVFWPLLAKRWLGGTEPPEERNSHRDLSHGSADQ